MQQIKNQTCASDSKGLTFLSHLFFKTEVLTTPRLVNQNLELAFKSPTKSTHFRTVSQVSINRRKSTCDELQNYRVPVENIRFNRKQPQFRQNSPNRMCRVRALQQIRIQQKKPFTQRQEMLGQSCGYSRMQTPRKWDFK